MHVFTTGEILMNDIAIWFSAGILAAVVTWFLYRGRLTQHQFEVVEQAYQQVLSDLDAATEPAEIRRLQVLAVEMQHVLKNGSFQKQR